jgi:hypothetical protein
MLQASKVASSVFGPALLGLSVSLVATGYMGCKKDEPPPPLPSAAPVAAPTPTPEVALAPEEPVASASASASASAEPAKKGTGVPAQSFSKCCSALLQNAASAPEPNKTYLTTAANMCSSMVAAGKSGPSLIGSLQTMLRGAGMPAACL